MKHSNLIATGTAILLGAILIWFIFLRPQSSDPPSTSKSPHKLVHQTDSKGPDHNFSEQFSNWKNLASQIEQSQIQGRHDQALNQFNQLIRSYNETIRAMHDSPSLTQKEELTHTTDQWEKRISKLRTHLQNRSNPTYQKTTPKPNHITLVAKSGNSGRRQLPAYEADVYGPIPFPETVTGFIKFETHYLLERQNTNGSWDSAEPIGNGRTRTEAGGTVDNITLTSMCAYSLRKHMHVSPEKFEPAIKRALGFVIHMIRSGKLRNRNDAPWRYTYALRFLINEYPHTKNPKIRKAIESACSFLLRELQDLQQGTIAQKSVPFSWRKRASTGLTVKNSKDKQETQVISCPVGSPAYTAGIRKGDILVSANNQLIDTSLRYSMAELDWLSGDRLRFTFLRNGRIKTTTVKLPYQYPGTLGLQIEQNSQGKPVIKGFDFLSNPTDSSIQPEDQILAVGRKTIRNADDLKKLSLFAGQKVKLKIRRNRQIQTHELVCAPVEAADFGIKISTGLDQSTKAGLAIQGFSKHSCFQKAGLKKGDRILRIDGSLVLNRRHLHLLEKSIWRSKPIQVTYLDSSGKSRHTVQVTTNPYPNKNWLQGYHGVQLANNNSQVVATKVSRYSPADKAGLKPYDVIVEINNTPVSNSQQAQSILSSRSCGRNIHMLVSRKGTKQKITFQTYRNTNPTWDSSTVEKGGGWEYYSRLKGGSTFLTADTLRELIKLRTTVKNVDVPQEMLIRPFLMLSKLRKKQPNSHIESYRYDAAGSFWRVKDIRGDIGRLNSAELACLMYSDTNLDDQGFPRTQKHLEQTLQEWLKHRGILDLVKFPKGHGKYSIAPYYWMYSYRTTLEAASYFKMNNDLKREVQKIALKAFFQHMEFRYDKQLEKKGWIIGGDGSKELHDSCQLLDGLATIKHLYLSRSEAPIIAPQLLQALEAFHNAHYGKSYQLALKLEKNTPRASHDLHKKINLLKKRIEKRLQVHLEEIQQIHKENPHDGLHHLKQVKLHFEGHPKMAHVSKLISDWEKNLP